MTYGENYQRERPKCSRIIGYTFKLPDTDDGAQSLSEAERFLDQELAREGTPLLQYGSTTGLLWLNGTPGHKLRAIKAKIMKDGWVSVSRHDE